MPVRELNIQAPDWSKVPAAGWILAVTEMGDILFEQYTLKNGVPNFPHSERLDGRLLRRCHCFDNEREYRYLCVGDSQRVIETVCDAEQEAAMDPDLLFEDNMVLAEQFSPGEGLWKLRVMNRYRFTEGNTLTLDDFRLCGVFPY